MAGIKDLLKPLGLVKKTVKKNKKVVGITIASLLGLVIYFNLILLTPYQQFPIVGGIWQNDVNMFSIKPFDLKIGVENGTKWGVDLEFQQLTCNGEIINYTSKTKTYYLWKDFSCNGIISWKVKALTVGHHYQYFNYGGQVIHVENDASKRPLGTSIWKIDGYDVRNAMPSFSYAVDGNLTIDFNVASDVNFSLAWATKVDLNYSTTNVQGSGTEIVKGLLVDGNKCQTNFIGTWNNTANSDVNLVGYWKFDAQEDVNTIQAFDYSGKGNHGQYINGADNNAQGKWDTNAGFFDGVNDYTRISSSSSIQNFSAATVIAWLKSPGYTGTTQYVFDFGWAQSPYGFVCQQPSSSNAFAIYLDNTTGSSSRVALTFNMTPNSWIQIGFDWNGTSVWKITNGVKSGEQAFSGTLASSAYANFGWRNGIGNYYKGSIEEFKIYNRALTAAEISMDYNLGVRNHRSCSYDWNISGIADANYYANVLAYDDTSNSDFNASNNSFHVNPSAGAFDFDVSLPTGITKFSVHGLPNSNNNVPNGQTSGTGIFNVGETGHSSGNVFIKLDEALTGITPKCDTDNSPTGATNITTSYGQIITGLTADSNQFLWCWADYGASPSSDTSINFEFSTTG